LANVEVRRPTVAEQEEAERTVRALLAALETHDSAQIRPLLADDVVYHNIPIEPAVGLEAALTFLEGFFGMFTDTKVEILNLAVRGDVVLTERIDTLTMNGTEIPLPVMGTFELTDGKVSAWRDYFDMAQATTPVTG
jgi:limonene-1,2-epoxide hydrolase